MSEPRQQPRPNLAAPELYLNRELSLLQFNRRVLAQAEDPATPLLDRLRFLTITTTNLDEFFEVRAASHRERAAMGATYRTVDGRTSGETLIDISTQAHELVRHQYRILNEILLPELDAEGIRVLKRSAWDERQREWIRELFETQIHPVLTPMGLDPAHPFPRILNKSLNFVVLVSGEDAFGRDSGVAIVQVPRTLPRVFEIAPERASDAEDYALLSSIIHAHIESLFKGMTVTGCYQFRVTRNGDLWVDEEEVEDLLQAMQGELPERHYAEAMRLEVADDCPDDVARFLLDKFGLAPRDLYRVNGPVNLHRLAELYELVDRPDLKYPPFAHRTPRRAQVGSNMFEAIAAGDIMLHHPYESFQPVIDLLRQAAADPNVLAIKQTLYRTGKQSAIVEALSAAVMAGKQVTVVVELRARFDEAANIDLATRLQEEGALVVYGIVGYKTHSKALMIVRREGGSIRRYCHLGTGNYHAGTARAYTDIGYLTADPTIGEEVARFFVQLTGLGAEQEHEQLMIAPFGLRSQILDRIEAEAERAERGEPARIVAKMNALTEPVVIRALYRASRAGVPIDLIVRGACCLRPGILGISETIRVRSVIGRFLEHSRLYYFHAGGEQELWCSSADWMSRNLLRRIELAFPIQNDGIKQRLLQEDLFNYLEPAVSAWELQPDGSYTRVEGATRDAQVDLLDAMCELDELELDTEARSYPIGFPRQVGESKRVGSKPALGEDQRRTGTLGD